MQSYVALFDYLTTARQRVLDWVRPLTGEQYARQFPYGLKTIHATLVHVAGAEWNYGNRLRGRQVAFSDNPFSVERIKTFPELETGWNGLSADTRALLGEITDWDAPLEYRWAPPNVPAVRYRTTRHGVATQLFFHEVHHRSQVMSMLRQLGVAAQNLDYSVLTFDRQQESA
jgi:uncharacterized damage-inducible protein DinB